MTSVAVVGSLMMDLVVRVPRLPVVGESLLGREFGTFVGGKGGNQALAAARLGAHATMIGRIGQDRFGERIVEMLTAGGVDCAFVARDPSIGTGVAIPMVFDDGRNSIIAIPQANLAIGAAEIDAARDAIAAASALLVQFEVSTEATRRAMTVAREAGVPVFLNPAPFDPGQASLMEMADYLVLNEVEAGLLAPRAAADPVSQAQSLLKARSGGGRRDSRGGGLRGGHAHDRGPRTGVSRRGRRHGRRRRRLLGRLRDRHR